jgi:hypothetical protein
MAARMHRHARRKDKKKARSRRDAERVCNLRVPRTQRKHIEAPGSSQRELKGTTVMYTLPAQKRVLRLYNAKRQRADANPPMQRLNNGKRSLTLCGPAERQNQRKHWHESRLTAARPLNATEGSPWCQRIHPETSRDRPLDISRAPSRNIRRKWPTDRELCVRERASNRPAKTPRNHSGNQVIRRSSCEPSARESTVSIL